MINSRLITLLSAFSKSEIKSFGDFVNSPYYNKEKVLTELYTILKQNHPAFDSKHFEKEKVYDKLFPGKVFNDSIFRNTLSKMLTLAEKFLAVQNFTEDDFNNKLFLLKELKLKKQEKLFVHHRNEADKKLESGSVKNEDYFYKKYLLEELHRSFQMIMKNSVVLMDEKSARGYDYLVDSFLSGMLKANAEIINSNKNFFGNTVRPVFLKELKEYLNDHPEKLSENVYINYYFNSIMLFESDDDKYFYSLKKIIEDGLELLSFTDRKDIFTILTNYCYYKISNGDSGFIGEQFKLYKLNIEKGIYKGERDFITHILFMNVVACGLEAGEFEWIENFIHNYRSELKDEHKENCYNFSTSLLHYWKIDFDQSIQFASKVVTDDLSYKHQIKSLYLKIYYDLNEDQSFYSLVDSYKHFVHNDKLLPAASKNFINNYILFTKKLFDMKNNPDFDEAGLHQLKMEITAQRELINKTWLMKKIQAFNE